MVLDTLLKAIALRRSLYRDRQSLNERTARQLEALVNEARDTVPMYRDLYQSVARAGSTPRTADTLLTSLPKVPKSLVKESFPDRLLSLKYIGRHTYPVATSGTYDRVMLFQDETKRACDRAADLVHALSGFPSWPGRKRIVIPPDACYERCGLDEKARSKTLTTRLKDAIGSQAGSRRRAWRAVVSTIMKDWVWRTRYLSSLGLNGSSLDEISVAEYFNELESSRPRQLIALPYYLYILAIRGRGRRQIAVDLLRPNGGKATAHMIEVIERGFRGKYRENYGTAELGTIAFDCAHSRHQHLLEELFTVEFLRNGRSVEQGELGEIVITDLKNRASPLIRYEVGDVGILRPAACACGRESTKFEVKGRLSEVIVLPDGRAFPGDDVIDFFQRQAGLSFCRLLQQNRDRFLLEVAPDGSETTLDDKRQSAGFTEFLGFPVTVTCRKVRRIAPEPSGKYRLVVSTSFADFHQSTSRVREVAARVS